MCILFENLCFRKVPQVPDSSSCSQYTEALSSSSSKYLRSCTKTDGKYDVIFDTSIRQDSVATSYGFTCESHDTTQVLDMAKTMFVLLPTSFI